MTTASPSAGAARLDAEAGPAIELSIVMPCLNEAETLATCNEKARRFLERSGVRGEVVIGDNGSTDGSQEIARRAGARVVDVKLRGYGAALYHATLSARGQFVIMGDADDSYDFLNLEVFVEKLREGYDLVVGNRMKGGIGAGAMPFKNRYLGNPVLSGMGRLFFRAPVRDFHCGLRGYRLEAFKRLDLRTTGMEFASEMIIKAKLQGLRMTEVPTTLSPDGRSRPPHLRPWRDGWRHLRFMLLYSPRWLFLYPGVLAMILGTAVLVWLFPGRRQVGTAMLDVHSMLYAAILVLLGFQSLAFGFFTKIFAISEGLMPEDPKLNRLFKYVRLETGLLAGGLMTVLGLAGILTTVWLWKRVNFGPLEGGFSMRLAIISGLTLALGFQIILCSFFLSVLGLRRRDLAVPTESGSGL